MPDKIVNHFVLADGSTARYSAEYLAGDVPEVVDIRTGYDGTVYDSAGDAVREQVRQNNEKIDKVLESNVLYSSARQVVSGAGIYVSKNIDLDFVPVAGKTYSLHIKSIEGGTSPHLAYLRLLDSNSTVLANESVGSTTTNAVASIVATEQTAKLRISLYPATNTPMPTGSAIYTGISLLDGMSEFYEINPDIYYGRMNDVEYIVENSVQYSTGKNIFDKDTTNQKESTLVSTAGLLSSNNSYNSYYFRVDGNTEIVCNYSYIYFSFYDRLNDLTETEQGANLSGNLGGVTVTTVGQVVTVPIGAKYMAVSAQKGREQTIQVEYGETVTTYEKYKKGIPASDVFPNNPVIIDIKADGSGDYSTLRLALESITDASDRKPYEIHLHNGTYDVASMFTAEEIAQQSNQGLFVPDYVTLVGDGNRDDIILTATLSEQSRYFSPLHFRNYGGMKNITVDATNCRYVVHDDIAVNGIGSERLVENCKFVGHSLTFACVYGSGLKEDSHWTFRNCIFDARVAGALGDNGLSFLSHNQLGWTKPSEITIENCRMLNTATEGSPINYAIRCRTLNTNGTITANNMPVYLHLYGNLCNGILLREDESGNYGSGILYYVDGFYNQNAYESIMTTGDPIDTSERFDLI